MATTLEDQKLIERLGPPFARALAEFIRALSEPGEAPATPISPASSRSHGFSIEDVTPVSAPASPSADAVVEFDPAVPAKRYGSRLRQIFRERGIKQSRVAQKLKVTPSVVSRVLKHPERSRLATIRRIADAAGISMSELV